MRTQQRQRGATLLEALVAFLVLALGMLSMARLQNTLRLHSDVARQRSEAVRLAQEDLERLRAFASVGQRAGVAAFADIASGARSVASVNNQALNTTYELRRAVATSDAPRIKAATVSVAWEDRSGAAQQVSLSSVIAGHNPALSATLSLRGSGEPLAGAFGRSAAVPLGALDLGDGRSALKPAAGSDIAYVFNNRSGIVVARCNGVGTATATAQLAAHLTDCSTTSGLLLSGFVRFAAPDAPQALAVALALDGSGAPASECSTEQQAGGVAYLCLVTPGAGSARWSGRSSLTPIGWTLGNRATDRKVCRYSADQDGSGTIDGNGEHPDRYRDVDASLSQQNFIVVRGDQPCPGGAALNVGGAGAQVFSNLGTVQHQP